MSALYGENVSTYSGTSHSLTDNSFSVQRGVMLSEQARELQPPALRHRAGTRETVLFFFILVMMGFMLSTFSALFGLTSDGPRSFNLFALMPVVLVVAAVVTLVRRRYVGPIDEDFNAKASAALARWRRAWFCGRCGGVYFPADGSRDVPVGRLLSSQEFRDVVWREDHGGRPAGRPSYG